MVHCAGRRRREDHREQCYHYDLSHGFSLPLWFGNIVTPSAAEESQDRDNEAGAGQRSADDPLHQSQFEAHQLRPQLGAGDVLTLVGSLADCGGDGVGPTRRSTTGRRTRRTLTTGLTGARDYAQFPVSPR